MFLRSAMFACAAAMIVCAPAFAETAPAPGCEQTTLRVYFGHDSAALDPTVSQMLDVAARSLAQCSYSELHVMVDASSPYAAERGEAIVAAMSGRNWDAVHVEPRTVTHRVSFNDGPEFAEVVMAPEPMATTPMPTSADAGV